MKPFTLPFRAEAGRILDAQNREVRQWGVNYYLPFNHNYVNIEELGLDHYAAVDRDIADFKRMGVDLIRMHVYEREITDPEGNIVENDHLRILDYLLMRLEEEGINVMMTPLVWFNTVVNQKSITDSYAYWSTGSCKTFGFSNFFTHHEMCWHEKALQAQERYLEQFFSRKSTFNGKRMYEYGNIAVVEAVNEPIYPSPELIASLRRERETTDNPYKLQECEIVGMYDRFLLDNGLSDTKDNAGTFCAELVSRYIGRLFAVVNRYFQGKAVTAHICWGFEDPKIFRCLQEAPIDAITVTMYAPCYFDSSYNDSLNPLEELRRLTEYYKPLLQLRKPLISYEFDAPSTLTGRAMGGFGYMMSALGVQIAAQFTYTPVDVAPYNPGWIVHYFNLYHTTVKAAAFMAGREIFYHTARRAALPEDDWLWKGDAFEIDVRRDRVVYYDGELLIHSAPYPEDCPTVPKRIIGIGSNPFVTYQGNGCYFLELESPGVLLLTVNPSQRYVNDPLRGKAFTSMANRYVNVNQEPPVSRLLEKGSEMEIHYPGFKQFTVLRLSDGRWTEAASEGQAFIARPGRYRITALNNS